MKKWYDEEYEFEIEVTGFLRGDHTEHYCRNGEEIGDKYTCTYGCPVNTQGQGICSKLMMLLFPIMEAVRSGGDYITLKLEPSEGDFLRQQYEDIIPGYYMNKIHWNSIKPDGEVPDDLLKDLLDKSYELVLCRFSKKKQREIIGIQSDNRIGGE